MSNITTNHAITYTNLLYRLYYQRFQGSMDYFEDSLMFVFLFH